MSFGSFLGGVTDAVGTRFNLPELGWSESLSGGATQNTGRVGFTDTGGMFNTGNSPAVGIISDAQKAREASARDFVARAEAWKAQQAANTGTGQNVNVQGYGTTTGAQAGGGTSAPAYDQAVVDQFDTGISSLNNALGRLPNQLNIARQNVGDQYRTAVNRLQSAYNAANKQYGQQSTSNMQSLRTNKNNILDQQSQGLRGLLRTLGMYGAVGSDADLASGVVADQATRERSGAGSVFAQNQRGLDTNWGNFENEDKERRKDAQEWKQKQLQQAEAQTTTTKQDLLARLAELKGQRAATIGGSFKGAAQPYLDQANALSSRIDQLARFKPVFDGKTPVYQAPSLDSYQLGAGPQIQAGGQPQVQTPALNALLGLGVREDEDKVFY